MYQRPYSWTTENVGDLLDDLLDALDTAGSVEASGPYFLGSIVLIQERGADAEVVDGQQRLITLTILLSILRSLSEDKKSKDDLNKLVYQSGSSLMGTQDRPRLTLRPRDQPYFWDYIQQEDGFESLDESTNELSSGQENLRGNALYLNNRLGKLSAEQRVELGRFIVQRCYLVVVSTPDIDSAYRIFTVLNDRGMPLSHTDILKSDIIGQIPERLQEQYSDLWELTEEDLGRTAFQTLFGHIRMIYRKAKARDTLLRELHTYVNPKGNPTEFIDSVLMPMAQAFGEIRGACYESKRLAEDINGLLRWLSQIDNVDWEPPAVLYLSRNHQKPELLLPFFRDLERLAAGLMILRANINRRLERYGRLLRAMETGEDLYREGSPLQLTPAERQEILDNLDGDLYKMPRIPQPVLLRLDAALSGGEARYDHKVISVEHVLPQSPPTESEWLGWFSDNEEREEWVHSVANLVLLSRRKNSQAQNFDFERKKREYFQRGGVSSFALTTEVLNHDEWTPQVLEQRQQRLLEKFKEIWRL